MLKVASRWAESSTFVGPPLRYSTDRVYEPEADVFCSSLDHLPCADVELVGGVIVFVLDLAFVNAGVHAAGFFHVHLGGVVPIVGGDHLHVSLRINRHPVEDARRSVLRRSGPRRRRWLG